MKRVGIWGGVSSEEEPSERELMIPDKIAMAKVPKKDFSTFRFAKTLCIHTASQGCQGKALLPCSWVLHLDSSGL